MSKRATRNIPVSSPEPEPAATIAIIQAEATADQVAPATVPSPAAWTVPEFIQKQSGLLPSDSATVRIPYGPGRYEGKNYGLAHHPHGFPIISSGATGRMFAITWEALIKLAIAGGIDESGTEAPNLNT